MKIQQPISFLAIFIATKIIQTFINYLIKMEPNNSKNAVENKSLDKFNISSLSSVGEIDPKDEEIRKLKAELQQIKMHESLEQKADKEMVGNLTGRIDGMEFVQLKNNKWNPLDCGPNLDSFDGEGLVIMDTPYNCIRAISPISPFNSNATKPSVAGYFEVEIINGWDINIGFCTQQFPLEGKWLGSLKNSIGICYKEGMHIDGQFKEFGNDANENFNEGDVFGVGIIHFPANKSMKCFATLNGELLGTIELPDNFSSLELFPATTFYNADVRIQAKFSQEKWLFDPSKILQ